MNYINEYSQFYKSGDVVLVEYWYNHMLTPVTIIERKGNKFLVSHNNQFSKIKNAPDELVKTSDILVKYQKTVDM